MGEFDVALVCLNGHVVNSQSRWFPQGNAAFCGHCGARTINACESCKAPIRGKYVNPRVIDRRAFIPPLHCQGCGAPYPWKAAKLKAAKEVTAGLGLEEEERALLERHIEQVTRDTPETQAAASWLRRFLAGAGKGVADTVSKVVAGIATELAKKQIWG